MADKKKTAAAAKKKTTPRKNTKAASRGGMASEKSTARRAKPKVDASSTVKKGKRADEKPSARREDKRESPQAMVGGAQPKNLKGADTDDRKDKGKATHELEASNPAKRPSRKSTRGGANHIKPDSQLRRRVVRALRSPKNRQAMRGG
jgi:hypothetical protein